MGKGVLLGNLENTMACQGHWEVLAGQDEHDINSDGSRLITPYTLSPKS